MSEHASHRYASPGHARLKTALARLLLALAYPWLAHAATTAGSGALAALALADIALIVLLEPLLQRRAWAWLLLAACAALLWRLAQSPHALLPLLLVPVAFIALVAWTFGRTLRVGRTPLVTRMMLALERDPAMPVEPAQLRYTARLTVVWAATLALLALANLVLALVAVPRGLLASLGIDAPFVVTETQWSWFANLLNYGLIGGLFVGEFALRKRVFPGRYRSFAHFLRQLASLGPDTWKQLLR